MTGKIRAAVDARASRETLVIAPNPAEVEDTRWISPKELAREIAADPDLDLDGNGVLDACTAHPADLDRDGIVGASDLSLLLDAWGNVGRPTAGLGDLNADGVVDASDLTMFLVSWAG
jgi:hypothetical protein